jgi:hypothetical protein
MTRRDTIAVAMTSRTNDSHRISEENGRTVKMRRRELLAALSEQAAKAVRFKLRS